METLLIITHTVKNFDEWKQGFDNGEPMRQQAGVSIKGVYCSVDDANTVTIISAVPNTDVAKALVNNPQLQADMQKAGVVSPPDIKILTAC